MKLHVIAVRIRLTPPHVYMGQTSPAPLSRSALWVPSNSRGQLTALPLRGEEGFSPPTCHPFAQKGILSHYQNWLR